MSENGKGSQRRPAAVPQQTYLRNFEKTFGPRPGEDAQEKGSSEGVPEEPAQGARG